VIGTVGVHTILIESVVKAHIAIFEVPALIYIIGVLIVHDIDRYPRDGLQQGIKLLIECFGEIEITSVIQGIPIVGSPLMLVVYRIWGNGRIDRNDILACQIAFSVVEFALIPDANSPDLPTIQTEIRNGHLEFFSREGRRNFIVKCSIFIDDSKGDLAMSTGFVP